MGKLVDMHFHLDFAPDPAAMLRGLDERGISVLAVSCDVPGYLRSRDAIAEAGGLSLPALGLHPWWIADGRVDDAMLEEFERLAPDAPAFGELGLDFNDKHAPRDSHPRQLEVFERACAAASASARAAGIRKPLSLHSVAATADVLAILERAGCLDACTCIFHWFSGSLPHLEQVREAGCWFSFNQIGMRSGKGREYCKLIPQDRLLLETDLPPENPEALLADANSAPDASRADASSSSPSGLIVDSVFSSLENTLEAIAASRGCDARNIRELTYVNAHKLLAL